MTVSHHIASREPSFCLHRAGEEEITGQAPENPGSQPEKWKENGALVKGSVVERKRTYLKAI